MTTNKYNPLLNLFIRFRCFLQSKTKMKPTGFINDKRHILKGKGTSVRVFLLNMFNLEHCEVL